MLGLIIAKKNRQFGRTLLCSVAEELCEICEIWLVDFVEILVGMLFLNMLLCNYDEEFFVDGASHVMVVRLS